MCPAIEVACGLRPYDHDRPDSIWETMPRGHDKTSFIGRVCNWALCYSRWFVEVVAAAADVDQANLILEAMQTEAHLNPWIAKQLKFTGKRVRGPTGVLKVLTADAPSAFGLRPSIVICDELTIWPERPKPPKVDLWGALWTSRRKVPGCCFIVITNAGFYGTWQRETFETACQDTRWIVYEAPGQLNSWMSQDDIEKDKAFLPPSEGRRVFDNKWIDPAEESGYLTKSEVQACEDLGRELRLEYQQKREDGVDYVLSLDYGPTKDRTALGVLHEEQDGQIRVDRLDVWQGSRESPVPIANIRNWIEEQRKVFGPSPRLVCDPYQLEELAQFYEKHLVVHRHEARGGKSNYAMAEALRSAIINKRLVWYPGAGALPVGGKIETLLEELPSLVLRVMPSYGYRFDHLSGRHDDRAVCVGMGVLSLYKQPMPAKFKRSAPLKVPSQTEDIWIPGIELNRPQNRAGWREGEIRGGIFGR